MAASDSVTATSHPLRPAGAGSGGVLLGRTVMIGVPVRHPRLDDGRATEDGLLGDQRVAQVDRVGDHAGVGTDGQPGGDLLALGRGGDQHGGRLDLAPRAERATATFGVDR